MNEMGKASAKPAAIDKTNGFNERFHRALAREAQSIPPIWFMRQAGRYHRHYQALRKQHSFMDLCKDPHLASEVALGPIEEFDFDVAILFSDLLFPLEALGMGLVYDPGPKLGSRLSEELMSKLRPFDEALRGLEFQKEAMIETRRKIPKDKSLIGFVGGPWTLFTYAVEGGHSGALSHAKTNLKLFTQFCEILVPLLVENIRLQFEGGAEIVMIFDTAAGELSPHVYHHFIVPSLLRIANSYPGRLGYYAKTVSYDHHAVLDELKVPFAGVGFDHRFEVNLLLEKRTSGFVQGNFDQALLFLSEDHFLKELDRYLAPLVKLGTSGRRGWVCGLGHGVLPGTPETNVKKFVTHVREVLK